MANKNVQENWALRGFSFGTWSDAPGHIWAEETHDVDQVIHLVSGEMEIRVPGEIFRPKPGDEVLVPAGTPHVVSNPGKNSNRWYYGYHQNDGTN